MKKDKMTSRERVRAVSDHKVPDRLPIDFGTTTATGIMTIAYNRLRKSIGINKGLAKMHSVIIGWTGRGTPRIYCRSCKDVGNGRKMQVSANYFEVGRMI